jgi:DNA-binding IclR family transcriptional regulator
MRTKNPFCTGVQLVVLRTIKSTRGAVGVRGMAREARMRPDTFANAITKLLRLGHIERDGHGRYKVALTGTYLINCANRLAVEMTSR